MYVPDESSLRIAVLAHACRVAGGASVGKNMVASLLRTAPQHEYLFLVPEGAGYEQCLPAAGRFQVVSYRQRLGLARRWAFDVFELPNIIRPFQPDVLFSLNNRGVIRPPCPQAILCHDPHLFYPSKHYATEVMKNKLVKAYHRWGLRRDLRDTALLLCQTPVAAERLRSTYSYGGEIGVLPNAVSTVTLSGGAQAKPLRLPDSLSGKWILLCLCRYYPHKNLESLVETFSAYRDELRDVAVILTISGDQHPKAARLLRSIRQLGLGDHLVNVGPVRQEDLAAYYRASNAVILPTLLESFSGSYLEAMQFGVPVLTSQLDFATEVCGDAASYFDPWSSRSIKEAILQLKNDRELESRLIENGRVRMQNSFSSWNDIGREVIQKLTTLACHRKCHAIQRRAA